MRKRTFNDTIKLRTKKWRSQLKDQIIDLKWWRRSNSKQRSTKNEASKNMIEFEIFSTLWYLVAVFFFMIGWFLSYFCFSFRSMFFSIVIRSIAVMVMWLNFVCVCVLIFDQIWRWITFMHKILFIAASMKLPMTSNPLWKQFPWNISTSFSENYDENRKEEKKSTNSPRTATWSIHARN